MSDKENPRLLYKRDGVSFYIVVGNAGKERAARECYRCHGEPSVANLTLVNMADGSESPHPAKIVVCEDCGVEGPKEGSGDAAVVAWNKLNYERANRPKWLPYAIGFSIAVILTVVNVVTCFYR